MSNDHLKAQAYMAGWEAGYHNATLAERKRIASVMKELEASKPGAAWSPKYIMQLINIETGTNEA